MNSYIGRTNSLVSMQKAQQWLEECLLHRDRCSRLEHSILPDRVLDIGSDSSSDTVFLLESGDIKYRYACLSYCWGGAQFILTKKSNLSSHKTGIPLQSLPQTFQDAIWVSRTLNIRYIWIDALCIIQDDQNDWKTQSQKMAAIFSHSYLTISALASKDPHSGLFTEALPTDLGALSVRCYTHLPTDSANSTLDLPLLTRGWAFQEALLSPRILYFGPSELIWECAEVRSCQCGRATHFLGEIKKSFFYDAFIAKNPALLPQLPRQWRRLLVQYSPLLLTKPSDKLVAIAGIAKLMRNCRGSDYLAGHWRDSFILDMLWKSDRPSSSSSQLTARAPSWSWASVDGLITYDESLYMEVLFEPILYCKLLSAEVDINANGVTGSATIECSKLRVWGMETLIADSKKSCACWKEEGRKSLNDRLLEMGFWFSPDHDQILDEGDFYVLRIAQMWDIEAIVVRSLDSVHTEYQRVGWAMREKRLPDSIWPAAEVVTIV